MEWLWPALTERNLYSAAIIAGIAAVTNVACAIVGCYLVLRRMSLLGDAIAHAVLPGLVLAYILSGTLSLPALYVGAVVVGLATAALTQTLHRIGGVSEDTSMGVVFTSFFAIGVILIKRYGANVDLDPDCVLSGLLELADDNVVNVAGREIPRALVTIVPVLVLNIAFVSIFWKELLVASFDPAFATAAGFRASVLHYSLMTLVALTTVAAFEQVGSILVVAMLVAPGAAAHLLTDRLRTMLLIAAGFGVLSAFGGYILAIWWDVNIAGAMTLVIGGIYLAAALFSPRYGIVPRLIRLGGMRIRILAEDILAVLFRHKEIAGESPVSARIVWDQLGRGLIPRLALGWLVTRGYVRYQKGNLLLLPAGQAYASEIIRAHRLWEAYEVAALGRQAERVHDSAMRVEHFLSPPLREELVSALGEASRDPHGRKIPAVDPPGRKLGADAPKTERTKTGSNPD
ncbi:MAG: metal ABC transporter permease [Thermoguttaceae bacterium]|nr:metal ABC transporter permease [Thermoguttaceae bacterium]MDW8079143.1 metal ABC transporter permease [Thermoguttaceae bacterium]